MANIASAKKRILVTIKKEERNKALISRLKTILKKYNAAIDSKDLELARKLFPETIGYIDNLRHKGILPDNNADRKKAAAEKKLNALALSIKEADNQAAAQ
ncbi:MAG: 30S ribosomal protein S20 [Clostridia bacterium]|nr:30S ribosomal protein S20 [Clostridia bacterium]